MFSPHTEPRFSPGSCKSPLPLTLIWFSNHPSTSAHSFHTRLTTSLPRPRRLRPRARGRPLNPTPLVAPRLSNRCASASQIAQLSPQPHLAYPSFHLREWWLIVARPNPKVVWPSLKGSNSSTEDWIHFTEVITAAGGKVGPRASGKATAERPCQPPSCPP